MCLNHRSHPPWQKAISRQLLADGSVVFFIVRCERKVNDLTLRSNDTNENHKLKNPFRTISVSLSPVVGATKGLGVVSPIPSCSPINQACDLLARIQDAICGGNVTASNGSAQTM